MEIIVKLCSKCKTEKPLTEFHVNNSIKCGYRSMCKKCRKIYYQENRQNILVYKKQYRENNHLKIKMYRQRYYENHQEYEKQYRKEYYKQNKKEINIKRGKLLKQQYQNDIQYKLALNLRRRLYDALKRNRKPGSAVRDLGCSIKELKQYLESKFQLGMTWNNWSQAGWHIDHIKPLSSFDLTDRKQFLEACNYTNLQPLWAKDNLEKSNK